MSDLGRFLRAEWDRLAGYGCVAAGVVLLVAGFVGVRNAADVIDEISYLVTGGIGSIFLLGVGATLLLSADLHDDFRKLHRVEQKLDRVERLLLAERPDLIDLANGGQLDPPNLANGGQVKPPDVADPPPEAGTGGEPVAAGPVPAAAGPVPAAAGPVPAAAVRRSRLFAGMGIVVAAVLFVAGSLRTANQASTDHVAGSVGLALTGALLVALVAAVMVAQLRASVEQRKVAVFGSWLAAEPEGIATVETRDGERGSVFVVAGFPLYHRPGCQLLRDRAATEVDRAALPPAAGPCQLCEPG